MDSKKTPRSIAKFAKELGKPVLAYTEDFAQAYSDFYDSLML